MKIREKKNKLLGVPIMCSNTAKDYQNFLPSVRQEKNTESNGSRELLLGDQTKRKRTEDTELNVCKRAEISSDTRRGQRADQQVTHTSRASGDQHALTPSTRSEAMSPGICDKPCHQQPRDARKTTSARHIGGAEYQLKTEHHETVLPLVT